MLGEGVSIEGSADDPPYPDPSKADTPFNDVMTTMRRDEEIARMQRENSNHVRQRARLEEREQRLDAVVSAQLTGQSVQTTSATVTVDELRDELRDNARAMQSDAIEFVGSYGK